MSTEYEAEPHRTLRQGDIVVAPVGLLEAAAMEEELFPEAPRALGAPVISTLWRSARGTAPAAVTVAQWCPVLVLSHDCELEKEFNERVAELMSGGAAEEVAVEIASDDPALDPCAVVAPLLPYSAFPEARHAGIRSGQRIGCLPVDALPGDGGDYAVDLFRPCTIAVNLLPQVAKVASLAEPSVCELRFKINEAYAARDLSVLVELEALVGHPIIAVEALPRDRKKIALILHLAGADAVHLDIRAPRDVLPHEVRRLPHSGS